ncbi:MAG: redoxin domain-containing protein [Bacteroidales bacterium]|nr:redoxin domain-containing protein [Bacteroidales bacterium]
MKFCKCTVVCFLLTVCLNFMAKAQYDITLEIKNCTSDTILMGYYRFGGTYAADTAVNNKGKFVFKNKKKTLEDGIYFFTDNQGHFCEFLMMKDRNLKFKTDNDNWTLNLEVKGSKDEELYVDFITKSENFGKQYKQILNGRESVGKQEYENEMKILVQKNDSLKEDFIQKHPNHLLSKILLAAKPVEPPDFPMVFTPEGKADSNAWRMQGFYWYKQHYFDNVDLSCDALLNTNKQIFIDNYNYYWETVMKYEKADSILYYADYWISKTGNGKMFNFFVKDISTRYLQSPIMGHDKVYVGMMDRYLKTGKYTDLVPSDIENNIHRADIWRNLLIGKQIPDLACPDSTSESAWHHLDELKTKYKFLVFWSATCGHCTTEIPKLFEFYKQYKKTYDFDVFAVHTEGEISEMKDFIDKHGINWINVNGLIANYDWREYFNIEKTPVIYILNSNDEILAKNIPVDNLKQIMDVLEKGGFDL